METKNIYFKSDFTVILASEAQWGGCPFRLNFYTASPSRPFVACFDGETYRNCRLLPDGRLEIGINQKDGNVQTLMGIGTLMLAPEFYLDNDAFRDHVCNEFIKPFAPVFVDTDGTEYQVMLDMQGSSTLTTIGTLPAFYQKGLTQEEHDALITATQDARSAAEEAGNVTQQVTALIWQVTAYFELIQRRFDESQTERTNTFNASERARTATFNEKEAQRDAAVAEAVRKANEACETLTNTFNTITSSLSADYESTKSQLAQDYAQTVASFNQRMTAIEQQFAGDREAWAKNVSDFIAACQATFDAKIAQWQTLTQEAANNASEKAAEAANVNAVLNGDNLTVTDRQGNSVTRNVRGPKGDSITMFPNVTIFGQPTIQESQISNFSADNYLQFPFVVDFAGRPWQIDCAITTGSNVSQQHNVLDSAFGLAFAFSGGKFILALSSNGTSWNLGATSGTHTILANTTYYVRISWNGSVYKLAYSTDKETWVDDITVTSSASLASKQIIIGKSLDNRYIFNGSVNMSEAHLTISGKIVWEGMDDAGLATRMAIDMSNIDDEGKQRVNTIVSEGEVGKKLSELESNLDEFKSYVEGERGVVDITGSLIDGFVIYSDGSVYTNPTGSTAGQYSRTEYLAVTAGDKLQVFTGGASSNAIIAAFDADKNYIQASSIVGSQTTGNPTINIDYVVPDGVAYIIITARNSLCPNPKVTKEYGSDRNYLQEKFPNKETLDKLSTDKDGNLLFDGNPVKDDELEKKVENLDNYLNGPDGGEGWTDIAGELVDGFVIYKDQGVANRGKVYDTAGTYHRTKPIKVEEGDVLKIKTIVASSCFAFATYNNSVNEDSNANELTAAFVDLSTLPKGDTQEVSDLKVYDFVVPSGVGYIIVSISNTYISTYGNPIVLKKTNLPLNFCQTKFPNKPTTDKFSEINGNLLWDDKPIEGGGGSISSLVVDLPVSDGSDIEIGYAYIDSSTNAIKVKS